MRMIDINSEIRMFSVVRFTDFVSDVGQFQR